MMFYSNNNLTGKEIRGILVIVFILLGYHVIAGANFGFYKRPLYTDRSSSFDPFTKKEQPVAHTGADTARPNIIMIVVDDLRWDEFSAAGHPYLSTPNIDRLVKEGVLFENAYHVSPLCSPNRASILTGQYPSKHGIVDNVARDRASHQLKLFAIELQKAGYETAHVGKWHMGNDPTPRPGYNYWVSFPGQGRTIDPILYENGHYDTVKGYVTDILTDRAIGFIHEKRTRPFFLYLGHKAVHPELKQLNDGSIDLNYGSRYVPAPRDSGKYKNAFFVKRENAIDTYKNIDTQTVVGKFLNVKNSASMQKQFGNILDPFTSQRTIRERAEMMLAVDESLGRILHELEEQHILQNTLILFTSDNGYFFGEHGLSVERRLPYEESVKTPLIIRYPPLIPKAVKEKNFVISIDYAPTVLELAGAKIGSQIQGRSLVPLLKGQEKNWRRSFLMECTSFENPWPWLIDTDYKALRKGKFKLIHWVRHPEKDELYDLQADPFEMKNLFSNKLYQSVVASMKKELEHEVAESISLNTDN
jgi:N-acetylglucosamine-6-sulfatase